MSRPTRIVLVVVLSALVGWWTLLEEAPVRASGAGAWRRLAIGGGDGSVAGRLVLDPEVDVALLDLGVRCAVPAMGEESVMRLPPDVSPDGSFFLGSLPPCRATLEIGLLQAEEPLLEIADLVVPSDAPCPDERLEAIDLRGRVHVFHLEVLDVTGEPAREVAVGWRPAAPEADGPPYARWVVGRGAVTLACETDVVDLLVMARGAQTQELFGVSHGRTVHLREGWPVRIALPAGVTPEEDDVQVSVRLHRTEPDRRIAREDSRAGRFHAATPEVVLREGAAEVVVPRPGTYEVEWRADLREAGGGWRRLSLGTARPRIEIVADSYGDVARPPFPEDEYRAALGAR